MLSTQHVARTSKAAQNAGATARIAVDQAAVVVADGARLAYSQAKIGAKCAAAAVGGFVATFFAGK